MSAALAERPEPEHSALGYWAISGEGLMEMLRRVAAGEEPDLVYIEEYANAELEDVTPF